MAMNILLAEAPLHTILDVHHMRIRGTPGVDIEEDIHTEWMAASARRWPEGSLLGRLWDYYGGCWFSAGELPTLQREAEALINELPADGEARDALRRLSSLCLEALEAGCWLAVFGE